MTETDDPRYLHRAVYFPDAGTLVVADFHVGKDRASDVQLSLREREDLTERLESVCEDCDPDRVVVAGDVLHAFERVPDGVGRTVAALFAVVEAASAELVVVRGNHDPMLESVYDGPIHDEYRIPGTDTVVCHGHERPGTEARRYVIGHDHPTIEIEGRRRPCFLLGRGVYGSRGADVLVVPTFNPLLAGVPVNGASGRDLLTPMVDRLDQFRPIVVDDDAGETLRFPPLGQFRRLL